MKSIRISEADTSVMPEMISVIQRWNIKLDRESFHSIPQRRGKEEIKNGYNLI